MTKREFVERAAMRVAQGVAANGYFQDLPARSARFALELWEEIEKQCPRGPVELPEVKS